MVEPLQQFSAIVADFYFSELPNLIQKTGIHLELPSLEAPVATFSDAQILGFHTISPDVMHRIISNPVGLVSMPTSYARFPILWVALAHEICGHDVVRAFDRDPAKESRLIMELQDSLSKMTNVNDQWRGVWRVWFEEAVADVYGMIFLGPHFAVGMAAWLSATNAYSAVYSPQKIGGLTSSFWVDGDEVSEHPPNLIRMYILMGALDELARTGSSVIGDYSNMLRNMIDEAQRYQSIVTVIDRNQDEAMFAYEAAPIIHDALQIGAHIASIKLETLGGASVADLLPWTIEKCNQTKAFCQLCLDNNDDIKNELPGKQFTSCHMVAGALMAVTENPTLIKQINARLQQGLSYRYEYPGNGSD